MDVVNLLVVFVHLFFILMLNSCCRVELQARRCCRCRRLSLLPLLHYARVKCLQMCVFAAMPNGKLMTTMLIPQVEAFSDQWSALVPATILSVLWYLFPVWVGSPTLSSMSHSWQQVFLASQPVILRVRRGVVKIGGTG